MNHTCPFACSRCDITCPCDCQTVLLQEFDSDGALTHNESIRRADLTTSQVGVACPCSTAAAGHTFSDHSSEERLLLAIIGDSDVQRALEAHIHRGCESA